MTKYKKVVCELIIIFLLNILIISLVQAIPTVSAATYRQGSTGEEVKTIQQKLKSWGYYSGSVDGVYGAQTVAAVKKFQRANGLSADGVCGAQTLKALGISTASSSSGGSSGKPNSGDEYLLARMISAEARGEPYVGQVAVGAVIMNRVEHPSFPNSISGVLYQPGAFSALGDGQFNQPIADSARKAAQEALNGYDPSGGAIYYYNPVTATNKWIRTRPVIKVIGKHTFCS